MSTARRMRSARRQRAESRCASGSTSGSAGTSPIGSSSRLATGEARLNRSVRQSVVACSPSWRSRNGAANRGPSVTTVWYSPFSPHRSTPRAASSSSRPGSSLRPRKDPSSTGVRTTAIVAVQPRSSRSSTSERRSRCHRGWRAARPAAAQTCSHQRRWSSMSMSPKMHSEQPASASSASPSTNAAV